MDLFERIEYNTARIFKVFSESALLCLFLVCIFGIASICCTRGLVAGLFEMHRSRSNIKKTRSKYGFFQKFALKPAWIECIHAKGFCRFLIIAHHTRLAFMLLSLLMAILSNPFPALMAILAPFSAVVFFVVDIPILVFHAIMDRYPFQRLKHEYRFKKYHNTNNHSSLF